MPDSAHVFKRSAVQWSSALAATAVMLFFVVRHASAAEAPAGNDPGASADDLIIDETSRESSAHVTETPAGTGAIAAPKFVRIQRIRVVSEDRTKTKRQFEAKIFSDDSHVPHGGYVEFYNDGKEFCRGEYRDGRRHGEWTFLYPSGKTAKQGTYADDKPTGKWTVFRDDGTVRREESYQDGFPHGVWTDYREDGTTAMSQREFQNGRFHGTWLTWYPTGQKASETEFRNGLLHGKNRTWYENGQMKSERSFKDGKLDGKSITWNSTGGKQTEEDFVDGNRVGKPAG